MKTYKLNEKLPKEYLYFLLWLPIIAVILFLLVSNNILPKKIEENIALLPLFYILSWAFYFNFIKK